jgi:hypothetical protein
MGVMEQKYHVLAGDPSHLEQMAQHYLSIANRIQSSVTTLKTIGDEDDNISEATKALKKSADDVAKDVERAESRYRETAQALLAYVPHLRKAQDDSREPAQKVAYWQGEVESTQSAYQQAANPGVYSITHPNAATQFLPDDSPEGKKKLADAKGDAEHASQQLAYWQGQWEDAANARNTAAETAKNRINDVVQHHNNGLKNPTHHWWSDAFHWVASHWDQIVRWAGVLSLVLGWVPILGQALAIFTLVAGLIQIARDWHKGWKVLLGDVISVGLTAVGGPFAKYLGKIGKLSAMKNVIKSKSWLSGEKGLSNFKKAFGGPLAKGILNPTKMDGVATKGLKSFGKELIDPYKFKTGSLKGEFLKYAKSGGGLSIIKLHSEQSAVGGIKLLGEMGRGTQVALVANDVRKLGSTVTTISNTTDSFAHGDPLLSNKAPNEIKLNEKGLVNQL